MGILRDPESLENYLKEAYVSKYAKYFDNEDDDDDWDDEEDEKKDTKKGTDNKSSDDKSTVKEIPSSPTFLNTNEIMRIRNISLIILSKYKKLKKCCDFVALRDKDHINDDGERESELGKYYNRDDPTKAFLKIIDGDVFSGYPDFRSGGNEEYEKDSKAFCREMNEELEDKNIKAKWCIGPNKDDEAISFGVKSTKTKELK